MTTKEEKPVAEAVNETPKEETPKVEEAPKEETPKEENTAEEETIADATGEDTPKKDKEENPKTVPYDAYKGEKAKRQELQKQLEELQKQGNSVDKSSLQDLADDLGLDIDVATKIASHVKAEVLGEVTPKLEAIDAEKRENHRKKVLNGLYKTALANNPEFKDIADKETVMDLATLPKNQGKTMSEIIRGLYGSKVDGGETKPTMETNKQLNDKTPAKVDFAKLSSMPEDQQLEILRDPKTKAEYNEWFEKNVNL